MSIEEKGEELNPAQGYIEINRKAYDALAHEYANRASDYVIRDQMLLAPLIVYLRAVFPTGMIRTLDVGPGSGLNLQMCEELGFDVTGVELSATMAQVAAARAPGTGMVVTDFLSWRAEQKRFEGIISKASLHLFPTNDATAYLEKCFNLLVPMGILYLSVSTGETGSEGLEIKRDYSGQMSRYKKVWTPDELLNQVKRAGFTVLHHYLEPEGHTGKNWINVWGMRALAVSERRNSVEET